MERLFQLVSGFLIDPTVSPSVCHLQSLFQILLVKLLNTNRYSPKQSNLRIQMRNLYLLINNPKVSLDFSHLTQIALKLPCGPQKQSQLIYCFRYHFAYNLLKDVLCEHKAIQFKDNNENILPSEVCVFVNAMTELLVSEKEDINFTELYNKITLLDLALDLKKLSLSDNRTINSSTELHNSFTELNMAVPEVSGLMISRSRVSNQM